MEKIIDFDQWFKNFVPRDPQYFAIYDKTNGMITGIYPEGPAAALENKIKIDKETAENIFDGKIAMHNCFVDLASNKLDIIQITSLKKIDDVLHRIIEKKYSTIIDPDILIVYNSKYNNFRFSLSKKLKAKKVKWDGDTDLRFIISHYNDPHRIIKVISFKLEKLYLGNLKFDVKLPFENFSIFTKRIFKKYMVEIK